MPASRSPARPSRDVEAILEAAASGLDVRPGERVVVAMSGGVDSSVAAVLLRRAGAEVVGLFMRNGVHVSEQDGHAKSCCSVTDARDARMVAAYLGIPFQSVDLREEFRDVIRYFLAEYGRGRTPNPCAVCNRDLKFDRLLRCAEELGATRIATGHYARIEREGGRVRVRRGLDPRKDQSYQLFSVAEENLAATLLPIGGLEKRVVRALAAEAGLRTAAKPDSQEICFVPSNDYRRLLDDEGVEPHPGRLVDTAGRVLGRHAGVERFTIGQRRGLGIAAAQPLYVVAIDAGSGDVTLGTREECGSTALELEAWNPIGFEPPSSGAFRAAVQVRYHHRPARARIALGGGGTARVEFDEPVLAVAPGQGAALYDGDRLLGGGWIVRTERTPAPVGG